MAKCVVRKPKDTLLFLENPEGALYQNNHILEPEFHQREYVSICDEISRRKNSFQLGSCDSLVGNIKRGIQPKYEDDDNDPSSLYWNGMVNEKGEIIVDESANICALKSICIRAGYIDLDTARSVSKDFYEKNKLRAAIKKNDVLINSTGDGTIGRVAVFNYDFPAVVDGHITILRFKDPQIAWFIGAFLMSDYGQKQISRYINGSSGQVEIYPQDISRIWVSYPTTAELNQVANHFRLACEKYDSFKVELKKSLSSISSFF